MNDKNKQTNKQTCANQPENLRRYIVSVHSTYCTSINSRPC